MRRTTLKNPTATASHRAILQLFVIQHDFDSNRRAGDTQSPCLGERVSPSRISMATADSVTADRCRAGVAPQYSLAGDLEKVAAVSRFS
jgi:hypothetical protein